MKNKLPQSVFSVQHIKCALFIISPKFIRLTEYKGKDKVVPLHAIEVLEGREGVAPTFS